MKLHGASAATTNVEDISLEEMQRRHDVLRAKLEINNTTTELAKIAREKREAEVIAQYEEAARAKPRNRDKIASSYNAMGLATGGHVMTCRDDDVIVPPSNDNILRMHSGSSSNNTDSEKVRKSYELMRALTRG
jgi:hypothetical protein